MVIAYGKGRVFHTTMGHDLAALELRRLHHHLPARDGMGGHRQGHAESARRLSDGHQNQHSRGVQSASRLELSGRRAARTRPAGQISAEAIDRIPLGPGVVTLGAETVSGWQLNYWSRFSPGPAFDFPAKVPDGRRAGGSPPGVSAANNCFYNGGTPCLLWPRLRRLRAMRPSWDSKSTCSSPPRPRFFADAPPVSARRPNTNVCPVCLGLPGALPVLNRAAVELAIKGALALNCRIRPHSRFARKNYFYPDLPKGYQISQYDEPFAEHGYVDIVVDGAAKRIGVTRVHMEDDAGKSIHDGFQRFQPLFLRGPQPQRHAADRDRQRTRHAQLRRGLRLPDRGEAGARIHRSLDLRHGERPPALRRQRLGAA